jgi:hypothetical protein
MSNRSSCRILRFLGMDVKCDKSPSVSEKSSSTDEEKLGESEGEDMAEEEPRAE